MVQVFRLHRSSLRKKLPLLSLLSVLAVVLEIGMSVGSTLGAPLFSSPQTAAQGRYYSDMDSAVRKDGLVFTVGASFNDTGSGRLRNWLGLTVLNNGSSYPGTVNADNAQADVPQKYPSIAFSPVDGTGYIVWRTKHGGGFTSDLRVIPPAYNGTNNTNLGTQFTIGDKLGYVMDQPAVSVGPDNNIYIVGYAVTSPVTLRLVVLNPTNFSRVVGDTIIDTEPSGANKEMDPQMCMDPAGNIHVVSHFPYGTDPNSNQKEYAYDRVGGNGFTKTMVTPPGWIVLPGKKGKDLYCAADGTVYAAINNTGQFDLFKRAPGAGGAEKWTQTASNVFGIYADSVSITMDATGKLWAAQADIANQQNDPNGIYGANVKTSIDGGYTFSANENAIPAENNADGSNYVTIDVSTDNKVHLMLSSYYGYSDFTSKYAFALTQTPPDPPANVAASVQGTNQINVTWSPSPSSPDSYNVYRSNSPNSGFGLIAQGITTNSFNDTGVASATTYYYKVSSVKGGLEGAQSIASNAATTLLGVPFGLTGTAINSSQVNLSWAGPSPAPDSYKVYRSDDLGVTYNAPVSVASTSYQDSGLTYGKTYVYKVTAVKAGFTESAFSNVFNISPLSPFAVVFTTQPTGSVAGAPLGTQPAVKVVDNLGQTVLNYTGAITISITPGTGNPKAALTGTTTKSAPGGVADFSSAGLTVDAVSAGYRLRASASIPGVYGDSIAFDESGTLAVSSIASGLHATDPFTITVTVQKSGGTTDTKYSGPISLNLNSPGAAYSYGMTAVNAVTGAATFKYLMIDTANTYTYTASIENTGLVPDVASPNVGLAAYTASPSPCTRIMVGSAVNSGDTGCSFADTNLQTALNTAATAQIPVYLDHRTTGVGFGAGQHQISVNSALTLQPGTILDGGCRGTDAQGLKLTITAGLTVGGSNNYLRGIFFAGNNASTAFLNLNGGGSKGNLMSCDKVQVTAGS